MITVTATTERFATVLDLLQGGRGWGREEPWRAFHGAARFHPVKARLRHLDRQRSSGDAALLRGTADAASDRSRRIALEAVTTDESAAALGMTEAKG